MAGNTSTAKSYKSVGGPANVSTKKQFNSMADKPVDASGAPRFAHVGNMKPDYTGEIKGSRGAGSPFSQPLNDTGVSAGIAGLTGLHDDIGERSGFIVDGYLDKQGTTYGESAKFNFLPPGMDISNQENVEINHMPLRKIIAESYPGDGWMPAPQDIPE